MALASDGGSRVQRLRMAFMTFLLLRLIDPQRVKHRVRSAAFLSPRPWQPSLSRDRAARTLPPWPHPLPSLPGTRPASTPPQSPPGQAPPSRASPGDDDAGAARGDRGRNSAAALRRQPLHGVVSRMVTVPAVCHDQSDVNVLIVDDHPSFRANARALLEAEGFEVVGEAEDGASALRAAAELRRARAPRRPAAGHRRLRGRARA